MKVLSTTSNEKGAIDKESASRREQVRAKKQTTLIISVLQCSASRPQALSTAITGRIIHRNARYICQRIGDFYSLYTCLRGCRTTITGHSNGLHVTRRHRVYFIKNIMHPLARTEPSRYRHRPLIMSTLRYIQYPIIHRTPTRPISPRPKTVYKGPFPIWLIR